MPLILVKLQEEDRGQQGLSISNFTIARTVRYLVLSALFLYFFCFSTCESYSQRWAKGWSETRELGNISIRSSIPIVFFDQSDSLIVIRLIEDPSGDGKLYLQKTTDYEHFTKPVGINIKFSSPRDITAAYGPDNVVHFTWLDRCERGWAVYYASYDMKQKEASPTYQVSEISSRNRSPYIYVDSKSFVHIAWSAPQKSGYFVNYSRFYEGEPIIERKALTRAKPGIDAPSLLSVENTRLYLTWSEQAALPIYEEIMLIALNGSLEPINSAQKVARVSSERRSKKPPLLFWEERDKRIWVLVLGSPSEQMGGVETVLLSKFNFQGDLESVKQLFQPPGRVGQPAAKIDSNEILHLLWQQPSPTGVFEIWYQKFSLQAQSLQSPVYISRAEGKTSQFPVVAIDAQNNIHAFWSELGFNGVQNYKLFYRNTVNPSPVSVWQKIGLSTENPYMSLFYSLIFSVGAVAIGVVFPNIILILAAWFATLIIRKFFLREVFNRYPSISLILPFALLFLLYTPENPLFINPGFPKFALLSSGYQLGIFILASLFTITALKIFRVDTRENFAMLLAMVQWAFWAGLLMALPASIITLGMKL